MQGSFTDILRKLAILGLPLGPLACQNHLGYCAQPPATTFDRILAVRAPIPDGGAAEGEVTLDAYQRCLAPKPDCADLCYQLARDQEPDVNYTVDTCTRVALPEASPTSQLEVHLVFTPNLCVGGRRPERLLASDVRGGEPVGRWWAELAYLEAASVPAFQRLARELTQLDAPAPLIAAARRAITDERRHRRAARAMARRHGTAAPDPIVPALPERSLVEVARENVREGCVLETHAAIVAAWQARRVRDPEARAVLTMIAHDEARHAALAWAIDAWARGRLDSVERARLDEHRRATGAALAASVVAADVAPALSDRLGLPDAADGAALPRTALRTLWS